MRIVAIGIDAGSTGKTTTTVTVATLLRKRGHRVLVVDADPQATATDWFATDMTENPVSIVQIVMAKSADVEATTRAALHTTESGVDIIPSTSALIGALESRHGQYGSEQRLKRAIAPLTDEYDWVLIDCPGTFSGLTVAALIAATETWTVVKATMKEVRGVPRWLQVTTEIGDAYEKPLPCTAVIPCDVPSGRNAGNAYKEALAHLTGQEWSHLVTPVVRRTTKVPESFAAQRPPTDPRVLSDYSAVLDHIVAMHGS